MKRKEFLKKRIGELQRELADLGSSYLTDQLNRELSNRISYRKVVCRKQSPNVIKVYLNSELYDTLVLVHTGYGTKICSNRLSKLAEAIDRDTYLVLICKQLWLHPNLRK